MTETESESESAGDGWGSAFEVCYASELLLAIGVAGLVLEILSGTGAIATGGALGFLYMESKRDD